VKWTYAFSRPVFLLFCNIFLYQSSLGNSNVSDIYRQKYLQQICTNRTSLTLFEIPNFLKCAHCELGSTPTGYTAYREKLVLFSSEKLGMIFVRSDLSINIFMRGNNKLLFPVPISLLFLPFQLHIYIYTSSFKLQLQRHSNYSETMISLLHGGKENVKEVQNETAKCWFQYTLHKGLYYEEAEA